MGETEMTNDNTQVTPLERFERASVELQTAIDEHLSTNGVAQNEVAALKQQLTDLQAQYDQLKAGHEDTLHRVAEWAENITAKLRDTAQE
jgi:chromosome segregation ATPase